MAVPERCKDAEKKFQDELNTFPDLPANIQIKNNGPSWNYLKELVTGIARGHHEAHVREWNRWRNATELSVYYNVYPEIMKHLWGYTTYKETDPFKEVVNQYALRVNNAHNAVINCMPVKVVNAVPGKAAPAAAPPPPPPAPSAPPPVVTPAVERYAAGPGRNAVLALRKTRGGRRKTKRRARKSRRRHKKTT